MHPGVPEIAAIVGDQGRQPLPRASRQPRQQPQVHQDLKAVANGDHQAPRLDELLEGRTQGQPQPEGQDDPGAVLIPPTEAARHRQQMIVPEGPGVLQEIGGVHPDRFGPGQVQGEGGLVVAIEAVAVEHQGLWPGFGFRFSVFGFRFLSRQRHEKGGVQ